MIGRIIRYAAKGFYIVVIAVMLFLFLTNDFGLVDIRKTSIVVALAIDKGEKLKVTAQIAVPQSTDNGSAVKSIQVSGEGETVGEALDEINTKTGFYPKLIFCDVIVLGESTHGEKLFELLDYFYRSDYISRTSLVATCKGEAGKLLALKTPSGEMTVDVLSRNLSGELEKTANVSTMNLKDLYIANYSESQSCYMPYIDFKEVEAGTEVGASGGGGDGVEKNVEFFCNTTALYSNGKFAGVLSSEQSFALNLLSTGIRLAILPFESGGKPYVMGLKYNRGGVSVDIKDGRVEVTAKYGARGEVRNVGSESDPEEIAGSAVAEDSVLRDANRQVEEYIRGLFKTLQECDCDALKLKNKLRGDNYEYYDKYKDSILSADLKVEVDIKSNS